MLKHARVKIQSKNNYGFKKIYKKYKYPLCSNIAQLKNSNTTFTMSNFDCDITTVNENCLNSYVIIEELPFVLEICKNCNRDLCTIELIVT